MTEVVPSFSIAGGFAFIGNVLDVRLPLPIDLTDRTRLARATDEQVDLIRRVFSAGLDGSYFQYHYEHDWVESRTGDGVKHTTQPLHKSHWRYFVLSWTGTNSELHDLQYAMNLVSPYLSHIAQFHTDGAYGHGVAIGRMVESVASLEQHKRFTTSPQVVDAHTIEHWRSALIRWKGLDQARYVGIVRAARSFDMMRRFPPIPDLKILGLFSIIEMLLTHNPNDKELGDSLSHQVSTKMDLLNSRIDQEFDYHRFPPIPVVKLWKKLYSYRSAIAHGDMPDFSGSHQALQNSSVVSDFLMDATRKVLRHALEEPELFEKLKAV